MAVITAKERAQAREGFNYHPALSSLARRLGMCLLDHLNTDDGRCDPGENRLACLLKVSSRAIRKAKDELRTAGLVNWLSYGGRAHTSFYAIAVSKLVTIAQQEKAAAHRLVMPEPGTVVPSPEPGTVVPSVTSDVTHDAPQPGTFEQGTRNCSSGEPGTVVPTNSLRNSLRELTKRAAASRAMPSARSASPTIWARFRGVKISKS